MSRSRLPKSRSSAELVIRELPDELLVYDSTRHEAHCLNRAAMLVWRRCDGATTVDEMAAELERAGLPREAAVVELALDELERAHLVELRKAAPTDRADRVRRSRRNVLRQIGLIAGAAVALPIVQSIVAPSVAQAASCLGPGQVCGVDGDCCSNLCLGVCV
ncbi:MAG: PqqD family protein [Myxococcales bacterium]|nr:PqqD family protein [Myxococcales bacterium]